MRTSRKQSNYLIPTEPNPPTTFRYQVSRRRRLWYSGPALNYLAAQLRSSVHTPGLPTANESLQIVLPRFGSGGGDLDESWCLKKLPGCCWLQDSEPRGDARQHWQLGSWMTVFGNKHTLAVACAILGDSALAWIAGEDPVSSSKLLSLAPFSGFAVISSWYPEKNMKEETSVYGSFWDDEQIR
ncbi:uncharacterized protein BDZ99DRAFT_469104 [Mytilinidion resinicola]|uniref:Uncharacterized protein n=1 Tax=Mytilinidion resinicola TaxID=574789 RepID=A0A6A6Y0H9_9PEZI|nr:uncharacterized protein BDZ99DRAFT_469104 [Mytilinidion resinicola]KAF2802058.1 hypothetical protein BDZ99DRAFT_469104 [Mytilinidion resinicola]